MGVLGLKETERWLDNAKKSLERGNQRPHVLTAPAEQDWLGRSGYVLYGLKQVEMVWSAFDSRSAKIGYVCVCV